MTTLQSLVQAITQRYPNTLPLHRSDKAVNIEEFRYLQGNREVVDYVLEFLQVNSLEDDRDELLSDLPL